MQWPWHHESTFSSVFVSRALKNGSESQLFENDTSVQTCTILKEWHQISVAATPRLDPKKVFFMKNMRCVIIFLAFGVLGDSGMFPPPEKFVFPRHNATNITWLELYRQNEQRKQRQHWSSRGYRLLDRPL